MPRNSRTALVNLATFRRALSSRALSCRVLSRRVLSRRVLSRRVLVSLLVLFAVVGSLACRQPEPYEPREPAVSVTTEVLDRTVHRPTLFLLGTVRPATTISVISPFSGVLDYPSRFPAGLRTGELVNKGEVLASVDNEDLRLRLTEAELQARSASAELDRSQRSFDEGLVAEAELQRAQLQAELANERLGDARRRARRLAVRAPAAGHLIVEGPLSPGTQIQAGDRLAEIAGQGAPRVEGWAAAAERDRLRPGLKVSFAPPGGEQYGGEGEIREVATVVDSGGTVRVVIEVLDSTNLPAPGEGVQVRVALTERQAVLTLPEQAILVDDGTASVYLLRNTAGGYRAERTTVELGGRGDGRIEILSGVVAGDRVAVDGVSFLSDGALARSSEEPATAESSPEAANPTNSDATPPTANTEPANAETANETESEP